MTYISGFTNIATGEVIIDSKYHDNYSIDNLYIDLIKPTLFNHGVVLTERFLAEALCKLPKNFRMEVDILKNRVLLKKEEVKAGYIYNSRKQEILYSFFFEKVTEDGTTDIQKETPVEIPVEAPSIVSEIEEIESLIVKEIEESNKIVPELIEELTIKLKEQNERKIYEAPAEQTPVKTQFQIELEKEVDLREKRKKTRDVKLQKKREKRLRR